jgi:hypothetical protein
MNSIFVDAATVRELICDRVGVCLRCGSMDDPVTNDAVGRICDACGHPCLVGMDSALEVGAVKVSLENAA